MHVASRVLRFQLTTHTVGHVQGKVLLNAAALLSNCPYCLHSTEQQLFGVVQHMENPVLQELPDANTLK